jgi:hypothetical protein
MCLQKEEAHGILERSREFMNLLGTNLDPGPKERDHGCALAAFQILEG